MTGSSTPRPRRMRTFDASAYASLLAADPEPRCCSRCRRGVVPGQFPCGKPECGCHGEGSGR